MISLKRTNSEDPDFIELVKLLDADLAERNGAIKEYSPGIMEVKRMYCLPEKRGRGIATHVLSELEKWAKEISYSKCILETGKKQEEAIALYLKNGYQPISNYGQYEGKENSLCFEKILK